MLVLRSASILVAFPFGVWLFGSLISFLTGGLNYASISEVATMILTPAFGLAAAGVVIALAKQIAVAVVPSRAALGGHDPDATDEPNGA